MICLSLGVAGGGGGWWLVGAAAAIVFAPTASPSPTNYSVSKILSLKSHRGFRQQIEELCTTRLTNILEQWGEKKAQIRRIKKILRDGKQAEKCLR